MIKGIIHLGTEPTLVLGLTQENLDLLMQNKPIHFPLSELLDQVSEVDTVTEIIVFAEKDHQGLIDRLKEVFGPDTWADAVQHDRVHGTERFT